MEMKDADDNNFLKLHFITFRYHISCSLVVFEL